MRSRRHGANWGPLRLSKPEFGEPMKDKLRILGVHGLGDKRLKPWQQQWKAAIQKAVPSQPGLELEFDFLTYDDIFAGVDISLDEAAAALAKLMRSRLDSLLDCRAKGFFSDLAHGIKWTAGYVVAWLEDEQFKAESRKRVLDTLKEKQPDVLLAHSLGSLVTYNALTHPDSQDKAVRKVMEALTYVSFGSQIGNQFVVGNLTFGRIHPLQVRNWVHLFNKHDSVFTEPIKLWDADNFVQIDTPFDIEGISDHAADEYLKHEATISGLWAPLVNEALTEAETAGVAADELAAKGIKKTLVPPIIPFKRQVRPARKRALLVGINEYPRPENRLHGCVNDCYRMSEVLQELGFDPAGIRLCLDQRATAEGILSRLDWLLEDPRPEDQLFFYFSGHGAQIPTYGESDEVDRCDETLVPYDFDWSVQTSITDDQILGLYSQLPYDTQFAMVFDCCHAGGMHRSGQPHAKGIDPPDDIRHRALRWNPKIQMWEKRKLDKINSAFALSKQERADYFGKDGATVRLGRAASARVVSQDSYDAQKELTGGKPVGPFLPIILEACKEQERAYEYQHGVVSYGAFTYALTTALRRHRSEGISLNELVSRTRKILHDLDFAQKPQKLGPKHILAGPIPWQP